MKWFGLTIAAVVTGCGFSAPASASYIYDVSIAGQVTGTPCTPSSGDACIDPHIRIGDTITLTAQFTSANIELGDPTSNTAGLYGLPTSGPSFFRVDLDGLTWKSRDDLDDGDIFYTSPDGHLNLQTPSISFSGGHVTALCCYLWPTNSNAPELNLSGQNVFGGAPGFSIASGLGAYGNNYDTPGFFGTWDFADSVVTIEAVPEPATWALSILGFGLMGAALRRRRRLAAV